MLERHLQFEMVYNCWSLASPLCCKDLNGVCMCAVSFQTIGGSISYIHKHQCPLWRHVCHLLCHYLCNPHCHCLSTSCHRLCHPLSPSMSSYLSPEGALYNIHSESLKVKRRIAMSNISHISTSRLRDNFFVVHVPTEYDYVYVSEHKVEIMTLLQKLHRTATGMEMPLIVENV